MERRAVGKGAEVGRCRDRGCGAGTVLQAGEWGGPAAWAVGRLVGRGDGPIWGPLGGCESWDELRGVLCAEQAEGRSPAVVMHPHHPQCHQHWC